MNIIWSEEEIKLLKKLWIKYINSQISKEDLEKIFQTRTFHGIRNKALTLGIPTQKQPILNIAYLKELKKKGIRI